MSESDSEKLFNGLPSELEAWAKDPYCSVNLAAYFLSVSRQRLDVLMRSGRLRFLRKNGARYVFLSSIVQRFREKSKAEVLQKKHLRAVRKEK
jgi:hypothetical protein